MKKLLSVILIAALSFSLSACSGGKITKGSFEEAAKAMGADMYQDSERFLSTLQDYNSDDSGDGVSYAIYSGFGRDDIGVVEETFTNLPVDDTLREHVVEVDALIVTKDIEGQMFDYDMFFAYLLTFDSSDTAKQYYNSRTAYIDQYRGKSGMFTERGNLGYTYSLLSFAIPMSDDITSYSCYGYYLDGNCVLVTVNGFYGVTECLSDAFCSELGIKSPSSVSRA